VTPENERLTTLEQKVESAIALDSRLKAIDARLSAHDDELKKARRSTLRDWIQTLGPYLSGLIVLIVAFWLKDSVSLALQREELDLSYVKDVRELIANFDKATEQSSADANAIALAMYGRFSIVPLIERLESGDVAKIAAERGLRLVGANQPEAACPRFARFLDDPARRFTWQTHKTFVRLLGASECVDHIAALEDYAAALDQAATNAESLAAFTARFSDPGAVDAGSVDSLREVASESLVILNLQKTRSDSKEQSWWR
jgi:hypothetical protein